MIKHYFCQGIQGGWPGLDSLLKSPLMASIEEINAATTATQLCRLFIDTLDELAKTDRQIGRSESELQNWNMLRHYYKNDTRERATKKIWEKRRTTVQLKIAINRLITRCVLLSRGDEEDEEQGGQEENVAESDPSGEDASQHPADTNATGDSRVECGELVRYTGDQLLQPRDNKLKQEVEAELFGENSNRDRADTNVQGQSQTLISELDPDDCCSKLAHLSSPIEDTSLEPLHENKEISGQL